MRERKGRRETEVADDQQAASEVSPRQAEPPLVLALDAGTSSVRAALYDRHAREVGGTRVRAAGFFRTTAGGGAEADAEEALALVARVIDEAAARAGQELLSRVGAVAVACFWHSLVGTDAAGEAVTPLLGWADTRAASQAASLRRLLDERAWHARTGCRFHASYWPAKLLWLRETRPAPARSARRWLSFGEFLSSRFAGDEAAGATRGAVASVSMASGTGLFEQRACAWDEELIAQINRAAPGLNLNIGQLPRVEEGGGAATFAPVGEYASRWPALRGVPWFGAVGDGAANNVGASCTTRGEVSLMLGTSGAARVLYEGDAPEAIDPGLWCYRLDRRRVVTGGALSDGGNLRAWIRDTLRLGEARGESSHAPARTQGGDLDSGVDARTEHALDTTGPDAHGLTVLPFWSGERSTGWHAHARGAILGLTARTTGADILRASAEAVAYRLARIADALAPHARVRASGGALVSSPAWTRIVADVLGRPVELADVPEATGRGAALLALEALGEIKNIADAPAPPFEVYEPDPARHAIYREAAARQQKFYETLVSRSAEEEEHRT